MSYRWQDPGRPSSYTHYTLFLNTTYTHKSVNMHCWSSHHTGSSKRLRQYPSQPDSYLATGFRGARQEDEETHWASIRTWCDSYFDWTWRAILFAWLTLTTHRRRLPGSSETTVQVTKLLGVTSPTVFFVVVVKPIFISFSFLYTVLAPLISLFAQYFLYFGHYDNLKNRLQC